MQRGLRVYQTLALLACFIIRRCGSISSSAALELVELTPVTVSVVPALLLVGLSDEHDSEVDADFTLLDGASGALQVFEVANGEASVAG